MNEIIVLTTSHLEEIARLGYKRGFNRQLNERFFDEVDPDGMHIVIFHMIHNDDHMRIIFLAKMTGSDTPVQCTVDCPFGIFNTLPRVKQEGDEYVLVK